MYYVTLYVILYHIILPYVTLYLLGNPRRQN